MIIGEKNIDFQNWQAWTYNLINVGTYWLYRLLQIHLSYNHSHAHCRIVIERKPETSYRYHILTTLASLSGIFCQRLHMTIEKGCKYLHILINDYLIEEKAAMNVSTGQLISKGCGSRFLIWYERKTTVVFIDMYMYVYIYISHFSA